MAGHHQKYPEIFRVEGGPLEHYQRLYRSWANLYVRFLEEYSGKHNSLPVDEIIFVNFLFMCPVQNKLDAGQKLVLKLLVD